MGPTLLDLLFQNRSKFSDVMPKALLRKPHREVGLAEEFFKFKKRHPRLKLTTKDAADPGKYVNLVDRIHQDLGVAWTYGGWLENREQLFADTYLQETGAWIHLGIDINVPVGTPILAALKGTVYLVNTDYPEPGGWGNFVIVKHEIKKVVFYSIYGHLASSGLVSSGVNVINGRVLGKVGTYNENGFWRPHTHFQFISEAEMKKRENPFTLDGYGKPEDLPYLRQHYPDPLVCLPMTDLPKKKAAH
ncbi:MAG: peptidoglycan DD-metalloendopeptidase family protein [Candidatus Harrisonbacteria bacterium]|nr:peptidoglycan DD-metalloendopeptidase family protein [Candidatus Harrisonbacteria bacterium]